MTDPDNLSRWSFSEDKEENNNFVHDYELNKYEP